MAVAARKVPSPADAVPAITARALIAKVKREGGRIYRMREVCVFVITESEELATWLLRRGGSPYLPAGMRATEMKGSYTDSKGGRPKWDIYIHHIPVSGERTIWEAAGLADAEPFEP